MPKIWKIRAWFAHWIGKLMTLAILAGLVLGVLYALRSVLPLWNAIYAMMDPPR